MIGQGVCSPASMGVGVGVGAQRKVSNAVNPNLLQWTEQFQNAVWVVTGSLGVTANASTDPLGGSTADLLAFLDPDASSILQTSATAASVTNGNALVSTTTSWTRFFITRSGFCFSLWLRSLLGDQILLSIGSAGGFVRGGLLDLSGGGPSIFGWGAKLETGTTPTGDATNYGMRTT